MGAKNHKQIDGKLLQTDKQFRNLKQKQKEQINEWLYQQYRNLWIEKGRQPHKQYNEEIVAAVMEHIKKAGIWIPEYEVRNYFLSKKNRYRKRVEKELQQKQDIDNKE